MNIDSIQNGIVIDHIRSGGAMQLYKLLGLDSLDCPVAIIKIDSETAPNLDVLGFVDPDATINVIRDGALVEKKHAGLPERIRDVLRCRNPRCITSVEPDLPQVFQLANRETKTYRCIYCEAKAEK